MILDEADMMTKTAQFALRRSNPHLIKSSKNITQTQGSVWSQTMFQRSFLPFNRDAQDSSLSRSLCTRQKIEWWKFATTKESEFLKRVSRLFSACAKAICAEWSTCFSPCQWPIVNAKFQANEFTNLPEIPRRNSSKPSWTHYWINDLTNATVGLEAN